MPFEDVKYGRQVKGILCAWGDADSSVRRVLSNFDDEGRKLFTQNIFT